MTNNDLKNWIIKHNFVNGEAAVYLKIGIRTLRHYLSMERRLPTHVDTSCILIDSLLSHRWKTRDKQLRDPLSVVESKGMPDGMKSLHYLENCVYEAGQRARKNDDKGQSFDKCPFPVDSYGEFLWNFGFNMRQF